MKRCKSWNRTSLALVVLGTFACQSGPAQKAATESAPAAQPAEPQAPAGPVQCPGPITTGPAQKLTINGVHWQLNGSTLKQISAPTSDTLVIGAVSDIKEDSQENLANLEQFVKWFRDKAVSLVVVTGDTGETEAQIVAALATLAKVQVPVLAIIGNRESRAVYRRAMAEIRKSHPNVLDLNAIRRVDTPQADLISMPGYHNATYLHADDGCHYTAQMAQQQLAVLAKASDPPMVLLSHGGPRQEGPEGIDRTNEGEHAGDPAMARAIADHKIPFGIFGNIHEAGGRATDLKGIKRLAEGQPLDAMYLNVGPADAVRWPMNDGTESVGMAALVTVQAGKARYTINRLAGVELAKKSATASPAAATARPANTPKGAAQ